MGETRTLTKRHRTFLSGRLAAVAVALCLASATTALLPASSSAATRPDDETVAEGRHTARISRTEYGIPHILARDFDGLTYGQSANPASPHYTDQTRLFSRKQWVTERFTKSEIASDPALKVTTLHS
ncbi:penicillin acylase family protein [Streptomyces avermitilis]|uniref:penicillin acylase family protein n=1 Tax=Streptomyces avermitilis TaxID=33903 RepID=UPI0033AB3218